MKKGAEEVGHYVRHLASLWVLKNITMLPLSQSGSFIIANNSVSIVSTTYRYLRHRWGPW